LYGCVRKKTHLIGNVFLPYTPRKQAVPDILCVLITKGTALEWLYLNNVQNILRKQRPAGSKFDLKGHRKQGDSVSLFMFVPLKILG